MRRQEDQPGQPEAAYELEAYDATTGDRLGHIGNLTKSETILVSRRDFEPDERVSLRLVCNRDSGWSETVEAGAVVVAMRGSVPPDFHEVELRFEPSTPQLKRWIGRIAAVSEAASPEQL